ncbi:hypothetical protein ACFT7S_04425 [Streptomyces sp. NPDC057136]|uniref:hypothetical protein n=1 Tax=Streptomyces sp. NPDC057136 TaxID=3346029 RepID=UPI00362FD00A
MGEFLEDFRLDIGRPDVWAGAEDLGPRPSAVPGVEQQARKFALRIARALISACPPDWELLKAEFALTIEAEFVEVAVFDRAWTKIEPPRSVLALVRKQREISAELDAGAWWRLTLDLTDTGDLSVAYDYGREPFPDGQLFEPEDYRLDLETYPRDSLPVWLAAYISNADRQKRSPQQAAAMVRADRRGKVWPTLSSNDFPHFPEMWARWAVISAAFVAARSKWGPRIKPGLAWFEGSRRSGSTLYQLPDGRAVLSGGLWEDPRLDAVYGDGEEMPNFYAGAPDWVADPVLNPRAGTGLLSFCYWWDAGRWYRGESPSAEEVSTAVPGIWTAGTTAGIVAGLLTNSATPRAEQRELASELVSAAEAGHVTRETVVSVFGDDGGFDGDGALYQLSLAGLVVTVPGRMHEEDAIARVRQYLLALGSTPGFSASELVADRFSIGWMVYVPVPRGEMAIGRAIFYIADDGVLVHSSSSVAPSVFVAGFEKQFQERQQAKY